MVAPTGTTKDATFLLTPKSCEVVFKVNKPLPSNVRGLLLLELEEKLKEIIDAGLTVWLEPVGDRSKLRNLRGINFKPDKT